MNSHSYFILTPITRILDEAVAAVAGIGNGIETYPLCDYIMQTVFLKMTGSQEQKMKCIRWELATNDYEYRRKLLTNDDKIGECSAYSDKNKIYCQLLRQIHNDHPTFDVVRNIDRQTILRETMEFIKQRLIDTNLHGWAQKSFREFIDNRTLIQFRHFANNENNLFENVLQEKYQLLYNHRNRCAHNTQSYQQNLPTLKTLSDENYRYDNYFVKFSLLILIDKIFISLYREYQKVLEIKI